MKTYQNGPHLRVVLSGADFESMLARGTLSLPARDLAKVSLDSRITFAGISPWREAPSTTVAATPSSNTCSSSTA